ncbi:hypothetical protein DIPPA_28785 [Diplonema papillatum]|nr:hypothetical protein DIPPA_28785 [Diplonema papillatum]
MVDVATVSSSWASLWRREPRALDGDVICHPGPQVRCLRRGRQQPEPTVTAAKRRSSLPSQNRRVTRTLSTGSRPSYREVSPAKRGAAPASLTCDEINAFDTLQLGAGGGIKIDEIVSPPSNKRGAPGGTSGAVVHAESELRKLRPGLHSYSSKTPVFVRFESGALHVCKCHEGKQLISLPFVDIKKIEAWEGRDGSTGLRIFCGTVAPTEVSLMVNEKVRRVALHKILLLKTRGVILPSYREPLVPKRSPSTGSYHRNRSASVHDDGQASRGASPQYRGHSTRPLDVYTRSSSLTTVASVGHASSRGISVRYTNDRSASTTTHHAAHPVFVPSPRKPSEAPSSYGATGQPPAAADQGEELTRAKRRERIKHELQQRRAERQQQQNQQGGGQRAQQRSREVGQRVQPAVDWGSVEGSPEAEETVASFDDDLVRTAWQPSSGGLETTPPGSERNAGGSQQPPPSPPSTPSPLPPPPPPTTDDDARRIATERRVQRQREYEDKLRLEREQRLLRRRNEGGGVDRGEVLGGVPPPGLHPNRLLRNKPACTSFDDDLVRTAWQSSSGGLETTPQETSGTRAARTNRRPARRRRPPPPTTDDDARIAPSAACSGREYEDKLRLEREQRLLRRRNEKGGGDRGEVLGGVPPPGLHPVPPSLPPPPPTTDDDARRIATERRVQRQREYEDKLRLEREQRLLRRRNEGGGVDRGEVLGDVPPPGLHPV